MADRPAPPTGDDGGANLYWSPTERAVAGMAAHLALVLSSTNRILLHKELDNSVMEELLLDSAALAAQSLKFARDHGDHPAFKVFVTSLLEAVRTAEKIDALPAHNQDTLKMEFLEAYDRGDEHRALEIVGAIAPELKIPQRVAAHLTHEQLQHNVVWMYQNVLNAPRYVCLSCYMVHEKLSTPPAAGASHRDARVIYYADDETYCQDCLQALTHVRV
jgi:hypothetical protein